MGTCCSAYGYNRKFNKVDNIRFHSFPLKKSLKKWMVAIRREDFTHTHTHATLNTEQNQFAKVSADN